MNVLCITPILNVSYLAESVAWFEKLGWKKKWDWGDPPDFGAVGYGTVGIQFLAPLRRLARLAGGVVELDRTLQGLGQT